MARFSERIGLRAPKTVLQLDSMDDDLRNGLWNACSGCMLRKIAATNPYGAYDAHTERLLTEIWRDFFKHPVDTIPTVGSQAYGALRSRFLGWEWAEVYDFVEFLASLGHPMSKRFIEICNQTLESELSAYRFAGDKLIRITNEQELETLQKALELPDSLKPVKDHLKAAIDLFSDRENPDYRNSIKESISAVEAACVILTGDTKATLGQALKKLEDKGIKLHKALQSSFSSLYGYTSDADGIRHALLEESSLDFDDAKFMLVSCSAFVNYLAAKASKAGVIGAK